MKSNNIRTNAWKILKNIWYVIAVVFSSVVITGKSAHLILWLTGGDTARAVHYLWWSIPVAVVLVIGAGIYATRKDKE